MPSASNTPSSPPSSSSPSSHNPPSPNATIPSYRRRRPRFTPLLPPLSEHPPAPPPSPPPPPLLPQALQLQHANCRVRTFDFIKRQRPEALLRLGDRGKCVICRRRKTDVRLLPCGHAGLHFACYEGHAAVFGERVCPVCAGRVEGWVRVVKVRVGVGVGVVVRGGDAGGLNGSQS